MAMWRVFQAFNALIFLAIAVFGGGPAIARGNVGAGVGTIAFSVVVGGIIVGLFEFQIRSGNKKGLKVRAAVEAISRTLFDQPAPVRAGYNLEATLPKMATLMVIDTTRGFTTDGTFRGVGVSAASHVSVAGRQIGELSHVYSHVLVDLLGANVKFRLFEKGVATAVTSAFGVTQDSPIGDPAFDGTFTIDMAPDLARDVFASPTIRARLLELRAKVGLVSQDFGAGRMNVIATQYGLAIRWPGEIDPGFAQWLRDLLLDMRAAILAHLDRRARGEGGQGYRAAAAS